MFKEKTKNFLPIFSAALALFSTLFIFGVSSIYFTNVTEYAFYYSDIIYGLLAKTFGYALLLSFAIFLLPKKKYSLRDRAISLVTIIAVLVWVQGAFLASQLSVLDGSETQVDLTSGHALISTALWIAGLIIAIFSPKLSRYALHISGIVIISQLVVLGAEVKYVKSPVPIEDEWVKNYTIDWDNDGMFSFSDRENVIFIIVDSFDQLTFKKMMAEDESAKNIFAGFTSYQNLVASFNFTWQNISAILTGQVYDNSLPFFQFVREAQTSDSSLPVVLKNDGFINRLYPWTPLAFYFDDSLYSNTYSKIDVSTANIFNAAYYRQAPHFAKSAFLNKAFVEKQVKTYWDMHFVNAMKLKKFNANSPSPVFFLTHWLGLHPPYRVDEDFVYHSEDISHFRQGKAVFKMLDIFFKNLKKVEAFDNSTIVVMADHSMYPWKKAYNFSYPFFLVKPKGAGRAALKYDDTPLSNKDVAKFLLQIRMTGETNAEQFAEAERYHYQMDHGRVVSSPFEKFLPPLREYKLPVGKHPYDNDAWVATGKTYTSTSILMDSAYKFPDDYAKVSSIFPNWRTTDAGITFDNAPQAVILNLKNDKLLSKISIEFAPSEKLTDYSFKVNSIHEYAGSLSRTLPTVENIITLSRSDLNLEFKEPITIKSLSIAESKEIKELIKLQLQTRYEGSDISWLSFGILEDRKSWNSPEKSGLWTAAEKANMGLPLAFVPNKDILVSLSGFKLLPPNQENYLRVKHGDHILFERLFDASNANKPIEFVFPLSDINGNAIQFTIETNTFNVDRDLGMETGDTRTLGYFLQSITLADPPAALKGLQIDTNQTSPGLSLILPDGWNAPEVSGSWSATEAAAVTLPLAFTPNKDIFISLGGLKLLPPNQENYLRVKHGDHILFERLFDASNANKPMEFIFPLSNINDNRVQFTIETNTFNTDKDLSWKTGDTRTLGYFLQSITLADPPASAEK